MRMSALSERCDLPVATIKYYRRKGLVAPGLRTSPTQAEYDEEHVRRLRLIRSLVEVGGLSLDAVRAVLAAVDDDTRPTHEVLGAAHGALTARRPEVAAPGMAEALAETRSFLDARGWRVDPATPALGELAQTLVTLRHLGWDVSAEAFEPYAAAADELAGRELTQTLAPPRSRSELVERVVVGTVVFETVLLALRRLAQQHHSATRGEVGR